MDSVDGAMSSILLTAYEPYDKWSTNVSQLVLQRVVDSALGTSRICPRVYPVHFATIHDDIASDLSQNYDYAIHMGQAPGYAAVTLEAIGVNVAVERGQQPEEGRPLVEGGAAAYQSQLPLPAWAAGLREIGVPATVSYHAGTYLCNAALYLSLFVADQRRLKTKSVFLHLPMADEQKDSQPSTLPSLPLDTIAAAVRWILENGTRAVD